MSKYRGILKNKAGICHTLPNSAVHYKGLLNLKSVWEIQLESQISNLTHRLNDTGPAGRSTIIRLKQAQIINWEPTNILSENIPDKFDCNGNFSGTVLKQANKLGIKFINSHLRKLFDWEGGAQPIKHCLNNDQLYSFSKRSLKNREIMFTDQLVDAETQTILDWNYIKTVKGPSCKETNSSIV